MSYFNKFPLTTYQFNNNTSVVKDILRRASFLSESPLKDLYDIYTIQDGETPESVALDVYGATTYHWVILLFNEIHNPYFDWPIDEASLDYYCQKKYGLDTDQTPLMLKVKHYEHENKIVGQINDWVPDIIWIPPEAPTDINGNPTQLVDINESWEEQTYTAVKLVYPVTFYEYEQGLNDEKRVIKLLKPELLGYFIRQFEAAINV